MFTLFPIELARSPAHLLFPYRYFQQLSRLRNKISDTAKILSHFSADSVSGVASYRAFFVGRAVHTAKLRFPASLADQPRLRVAAFGVYASPLRSLDIGEAEARL
jgi:hypothetical protein